MQQTIDQLDQRQEVNVKTKEILLVNLPPGANHDYENAGSTYPNTALLLIGTILKQRGFPIVFVDGALEPNYEKIALEKVKDNTLLVGFSAMSSQINLGYQLCKKLKAKNDEVTTIIGGPHPTLYPEQTVDNPYIDMAIINEGTKTIVEIVDALLGKIEKEQIRGVAYKQGDGTVRVAPSQIPDNVDDIPHVDFDLLDIDRYLNATSVYDRELRPDNASEKIRLMPMLTGLGCSFKCTFCINVIWERAYRFRSAKSIVDEIERLQKKYNANAFLFLDEDFCIDKKRVQEFCRLVQERGLKFKGRIWTRVSYFKRESFQQLALEMDKAGIKSIAMGAESGSQKILNMIKKAIRTEDIVRSAKVLSRSSITPRYSFMTAFEGESKEETIATYKMIANLYKLNPLTDIAGPFIYRYYPGSPLFDSMVEKFDVYVPKSIEEWEHKMHDDGALVVDINKWVWPGFIKYHEPMHAYITLYSRIINKPHLSSRWYIKLIKKMIIWRLLCGEHLYQVDYFTLRAIKKVRNFIRSLKPTILKNAFSH